MRGARKYRNVPTEYAGVLYPSAAEAYRASQLEMLRRAGDIQGWTRGAKVLIVDGGPGRRVHYTPDFVVYGPQGAWAEDVKGVVPRDFRMRAILYQQATFMPLRVVDKYGAPIWTPEGKRARKGGKVHGGNKQPVPC